MTDSPPARDSLPYRDCVGIAVFNANGNVFMGASQERGRP